MDGFLCARCGLPLYVSAVSEEDKRPRIWHVHATSPADAEGRVVLDLKVVGRRGCQQPATVAEGLPW